MQLGIPFRVEAPDVQELSDGEPRGLVIENALRKARAVAASGAASGAPVLGVDTAVVLGDRVFGKPGNEGDARGFLEALSGRHHDVWSGIALVEAGRERTAAARTAVRFRELDATALDWYLATGEWRERAGGYAIQARGAALVEGIEGDYLNVVGLPVAAMLRMAPELLSPAHER